LSPWAVESQPAATQPARDSTGPIF